MVETYIWKLTGISGMVYSGLLIINRDTGTAKWTYDPNDPNYTWKDEPLTAERADEVLAMYASAKLLGTHTYDSLERIS